MDDLSSLPNASKKDSAAPAIQKYAEPPKGKNKVRKHQEKKHVERGVVTARHHTWGSVGQPYMLCPVICMSPVFTPAYMVEYPWHPSGTADSLRDEDVGSA